MGVSRRLYLVAAAIGAFIACNETSQPIQPSSTGGSQSGAIDPAAPLAGGGANIGVNSGSGGASGIGGTAVIENGGSGAEASVGEAAVIDTGMVDAGRTSDGSCDANASQLEGYINWAEGFAGGRPIWIMEWGCLNQSAPDVGTVVAFYQGAIAMFARHPRVERYAWYPWFTNCGLVNEEGSLSALGEAYAAAPAYK